MLRLSIIEEGDERVGGMLLERVIPAGEARLGAIRLAPPALLVAGRIVDDQGRPLPGALVSLAGIGPLPFLPGISRYTCESGLFTIKGHIEDPMLSVHASRTGYFQAEGVPAHPGIDELELRLEKAGAVAGSIRFPDGFDGSHSGLLSVKIWPGNPEGVQWSRWSPDGEFKLDATGIVGPR